MSPDPTADILAAVRAISETSAPIGFVLILLHWDIFLQGTLNTVALVLIGLSFGALIALPMAIARWQRMPVASPLVGAFVYVFRGTPMLVQAYLIYEGLAQFDWLRDSVLWVVLKEPRWCCAIAFAIDAAAYQVEIYRGGLDAVPRTARSRPPSPPT
jgi:arginine/ornithine transport system permease protein